MPIKRVMKEIPLEELAVEGILENDTDSLTPYQQECLTRFGMTHRMEQEAYLTMHPEIQTMMASFVKKMVGMTKRKEVLKEAAEYFTRPRDVIDNEIREKLNVSTDEPYLQPVPTPEPTLSENMFSIILNTVDKAIFLHVNDEALRYDTAYVELSKAVEDAMEVPVLEIRQDITELFHEAYRLYEADIMAKE